MSTKLLLFDLDWTVLYTGGAGIRALDYAFLEHFNIPKAMHGISPDGKTDPAIIRELIQVHLNREAEKAEITAICQRYVDRLPHEIAHTAEYVVLPGIPELLDRLDQNPDALVGLGTGNLEAGARAKLSRTPLLRYFKFGGYGDDSEMRSEVLQAGVQRGQALAGQAFAPRDVVVIGDHFRDIQAARAIGATIISVATGHLKEPQLRTHRPDFLFRNLADTARVLEAIFS